MIAAAIRQAFLRGRPGGMSPIGCDRVGPNRPRSWMKASTTCRPPQSPPRFAPSRRTWPLAPYTNRLRKCRLPRF